MAVHQFCNCNSIVVSCKWIPRADNTIADKLSKQSDCDDWSIKQVVFDYFDYRWGAHTCDRFASSYNKNANYLIQSIYVQVHVGLMHWSRCGLIMSIGWLRPLD